jgi:hypothetical protein
MHYDEELVTYLPMLIHQISRGKYTTFTTLASFFVFEDSMSEGMQASTVCSEEVLSKASDYQLPTSSLLPIRPEDVTFDVADETQWCAIAAVPHLDASVNQPLQSNVPTLVFKQSFWIYGKRKFKASSSPYLNKNCGYFFKNFNEFIIRFNKLNNNSKINPKDWLNKKMSQDVSIKNLLEIIKK